MTTAETFKVLDELNAAIIAIARTQGERTFIDEMRQLELEHQQAQQLAEDEEGG